MGGRNLGVMGAGKSMGGGRRGVGRWDTQMVQIFAMEKSTKRWGPDTQGA